MPILVVCSHCGEKGNAPDSAVGKKVRCPKCRQPMTVPGGSGNPTTSTKKKPSPTSEKSVIQFSCPSCMQELEAPTSAVGQQMTCSDCDQKLWVPRVSSQSPRSNPPPASTSNKLPAQPAATPSSPSPSPSPVMTAPSEGSPVPMPQLVTPSAPVNPMPLPVPELVEPTTTTFGMGRLVYWSSLLGGWTAFLGWGMAELAVGRWVAEYYLLSVLMTMVVAVAIGVGLSQVEALTTAQWNHQGKRLLPGLVGGLAGGLVGGLIACIPSDSDVLSFFVRLVGWTLIGGSIGVSEGIFRGDPRRLRNGLIGGAIGGFLGGALFTPVVLVVTTPVSARAFAFALSGLSLGLCLGLLQVLLKDAWLTVEEGATPGRLLILYDEPVLMGTGEKATLMFVDQDAEGVERLHLRIRRSKRGDWVLEDNGSRNGTFHNGERIQRTVLLQDEDVIQFGKNKVRFHEPDFPRETDVAFNGA